MVGRKIRLLITDFDGTLVDTFRANYMAYRKAFEEMGLVLPETEYSRCFGYRFERFMEAVGIEDKQIALKIKELKSIYYPNYFTCLKIHQYPLQLPYLLPLQG